MGKGFFFLLLRFFDSLYVFLNFWFTPSTRLPLRGTLQAAGVVFLAKSFCYPLTFI